jgi:hypothetical protein
MVAVLEQQPVQEMAETAVAAVALAVLVAAKVQAAAVLVVCLIATAMDVLVVLGRKAETEVKVTGLFLLEALAI